MGDSDKELKISVVTVADTSGLTQTATGLKNLTDAQNEESAATKAATETTEGLSLGKRELLESMRPLISQFPVLGEVARSAFNSVTIITFGLIGAFELLNSRITQMTQSLGAIQLPDLSDGIRQAQDLATAWNGVADAVGAAETAYNSAQQILDRGTKGVKDEHEAATKLLEVQKQIALQKLEGQHAAGEINDAQYQAGKNSIEQSFSDAAVQAGIQARNAELSQKFNAAANFDIESKAQQAQADAIAQQYGLGKTPEEEAARKTAAQGIIDAKQKSIDASRENLALLNEATDDTTGQLKSDFDWAKLIGHYGAGVTTPEGLKKAGQIEQQNISQNEADQKDLEQQMAAREEAAKKRDDLLKKAAENAGKHESTLLDASGQQNPNVIGSVAWQNAQDSAAGRAQGIAFGEGRFTDDLKQVQSDLKSHGPRAQQSLADIKSALQDAVKTIQMLGNMGADISSLKQELARVQQQVQAMPNIMR